MTASPQPARAAEPLVRIEDLKVHFPTSQARNAPVVRAVDGVSFDVPRNTIVGLVGESGSGKTTTGRALLRLFAPTAGRLLFDGQDITRLSEKEMLPWRRRMQIVFQDPYASLNPRMTVAEILGEALDTHKLAQHRRAARIGELLERVGLNADHSRRYPHEFSGGQRQRIGIARALMVAPKFLVCDEPVAALDVSIQAQVINLFMDLREQHGFTYLFISHDLGVVRHISDRVAIMYLGKIVEISTSAEIFARANHPYTQALMAEVPDVARRGRKFTPIKGEIPSPLNPPSGCTFNPRCPHAMPRCREQAPTLKEISPGHWSACHLNEATA